MSGRQWERARPPASPPGALPGSPRRATGEAWSEASCLAHLTGPREARRGTCLASRACRSSLYLARSLNLKISRVLWMHLAEAFRISSCPSHYAHCSAWVGVGVGKNAPPLVYDIQLKLNTDKWWISLALRADFENIISGQSWYNDLLLGERSTMMRLCFSDKFQNACLSSLIVKVAPKWLFYLPVGKECLVRKNYPPVIKNILTLNTLTWDDKKFTKQRSSHIPIFHQN